ncbi:metallophosphoesterase [Cryomorphaceae bacterium]|nr:metallophosphoesterase [Cryomorphaceae bacterium]
MNQMIVRLLIIIGILFFLDLYAFQAVRTATRGKLWLWTYWAITLGLFAWLGYTVLNFDRSSGPQNRIFSWLFGMMVLFYVPKMVIAFPLLLEDLFRVFRAGWKVILSVLPSSEANVEATSYWPARRKFISQLGLILAALPFASILYGITRGKYRYEVWRHTLYFDDLPEAFDGFRIAQISDIHSGSFDNAEKVAEAVQLVNEQESDVILFTGDLVNNAADEMDPWKETFSALSAQDGVYSVLGNHDYGDYMEWPSAEAKAANMQKLYDTHREIGMDLLRNEHRTLERDGQKLHIVGVENWGKPPFPQYGDLDRATEGIGDDEFCVLMSHDPSHYDLEVKQHPKNFRLTLSGHTHGMQFGIEIPGIKWSPVKYRYPKWAGLYEEAGRFLNVNRGFGFLAFPGRVGIWPEVTVLELKRRATA